MLEARSARFGRRWGAGLRAGPGNSDSECVGYLSRTRSNQIGSQSRELKVDIETVFQRVDELPFMLSFKNEDVSFALVGIETDRVDLGGLFDLNPGIPGLKTVTLRPQPSQPAGMVLIVDGRRYEPTKTGALWAFEVPSNRNARVIAFWPKIDGRPHLCLKEIESANDLEGRAVSIAPNLPLDSEVAIHVTGLPSGWLTAELVYDRVQTGIRIAEGLVTSRRARSIPSQPSGNDYELSLWVRVIGRTEIEPSSRRLSKRRYHFIEAALRWIGLSSPPCPLSFGY